MPKIIVKSIQFYQKLKPLRVFFLQLFHIQEAPCRFQPTCSQYVSQAIEKYGVIKGVYMGIKRIIRCHPWSKGGYDPA